MGKTETFKKEVSGVSAPDFSVRSYLNGSYSAAIRKNGIVSVLLDYSEYSSEAAHVAKAQE